VVELVPLRRRRRSRSQRAATNSTSGGDTVKENVHVGETPNHVDGIKR